LETSISFYWHRAAGYSVLLVFSSEAKMKMFLPVNRRDVNKETKEYALGAHPQVSVSMCTKFQLSKLLDF
jgi:hypothetical protein